MMIINVFKFYTYKKVFFENTLKILNLYLENLSGQSNLSSVKVVNYKKTINEVYLFLKNTK